MRLRWIGPVLALAAALALSPNTHATFAGDNGKIAIYDSTINPDGSGEAELRPGAGIAQWSPDGTKVLYVELSNPGCTSACEGRIGVMNSDGTGATQLTSFNSGFPRWSADGSKIAFLRQPTYQLYVMNADGSGVTQLTSSAIVGIDYLGFRWSPDGSRILFSRGSELRTVALDGSGEKLVQSPVYGTGDWSPDGTRIVFASDRRLPTPWTGYEPYELYTVHPDGAGLVRITTVTPSGSSCDTLPDQEYEPRWSQDGQWIAFIQRGDPWCIYDDENVPPLGMGLVKSDGTGYRALDPSDWSDFEVEGAPIWSPDSAHVTYAASGGTFVVDVAGGDARLVTGFPSPSDWQPLPVNTPSSFARPRGATPVYASLVPAHAPCTAPDTTHGAPLAFGACGPPAPTSGNLTVGTPDANGLRANSLGFMELRVRVGALGGPDDSDVRIKLGVQSVYRASDLSDYAGELEARTALRLTDKRDGIASTTIDLPLSFAVPCTATADPNAGGNCAIDTTADAIRPGFVPEGERSVWGLGQAQVYDGGADGIASTTGDNQLFQVEGLFVP